MFHRWKAVFFISLCLIIACLSSMGPAFYTDESEDSDLIVDGVFEEKFQDDFWDRGWQKLILFGNPEGNYYSLNRKRLSLELPSTQTAVVLTNPNVSFSDVLVEATFENILSNVASYAVICRYSEDGWYELRVNVSGPEAGSYKLLKYDFYRKEQYKNPYVLLHKGMDRIFSVDIKLGLNVKNKLGLLCEGDEIKAYINDKEQFPIKNGKITDDQFEEGSVGFSAQTYGEGLAKIDIVKFSAKEVQ
ncbi:MAG TPA: hypothetical protein PLQ28_02890 [Flexilinea sp.]|nr:hypothetical protein [Flexilinea sp.]HPS47827.1 hypothetical protein [Flexilinea sp.]